MEQHSTEKSTRKVAPRIVAATGVSANSKDKNLAKVIEQAMSNAVIECSENGITDPDKIRAAMQAARKKAKEEYGEPRPKAVRRGEQD